MPVGLRQADVAVILSVCPFMCVPFGLVTMPLVIG